MTPTLLVVDDEPCVQRVVERRGEKEGFRVLPALTLREGLRLAIDEQPDIVLLDMSLPDGVGSQLLQQLKSHPRTRHIPVVVWSGRDTPDMKREVLRAGAVAFLSKSDFAMLTVTLRILARGHEPSGIVRSVEPVADSEHQVVRGGSTRK